MTLLKNRPLSRCFFRVCKGHGQTFHLELVRVLRQLWLSATARELQYSEKPEASLLPTSKFSPGEAGGPLVKAEVRRSFITTTVREQRPRSHHKGAT